MKELETKHLFLRQWQPKDFEDFAAFYANEEAAKYVGGLSDRDQSWRRIATYLGHWDLLGYGYWAVEEKGTGSFVGCVGLWFSDGWPELELGYWIVPNMQKKGYGAEAGLKTRNFALEVLKAKSLVSYIHPDNEPSKRLAEKLGARFETVFELLEHGPHCVYRYW